MKIYALKSCDTCRKAIRSLQDAGHELEIIDVRADGIPAAKLAEFHEIFGQDLVNKRSTTWRNLTDEERATDPLKLLAEYSTLMKRPVIEANDTLFLGWTTEVRNALLG